MKIKQDKVRKKSCPKHCTIHNIDYIETCPKCDNQQSTFDILQDEHDAKLALMLKHGVVAEDYIWKYDTGKPNPNKSKGVHEDEV